jgi:hypothetical protein
MMAATLPVDSIWTRKTTRLCHLRPAALLLSRCASWLSHHLLLSSHCPTLLSSCCTAILSLHHSLVHMSRQLVVALPLAIISFQHPLIVLLCQLVVTSPLVVLLLRPVPPSRPLIALAGCCDPSQCAALLSSCCLVVLPSCRLVAPACCHIIISHHPLVVTPSRPLIVLAGCCIASPCTTHSSSHRAGWLLHSLSLHHPLVLSSSRPSLPHHSLAVVCVKCPQMLLPPSNATTTAAIEGYLYCPLLPQLPSIATIKCQHPPLSITLLCFAIRLTIVITYVCWLPNRKIYITGNAPSSTSTVIYLCHFW